MRFLLSTLLVFCMGSVVFSQDATKKDQPASVNKEDEILKRLEALQKSLAAIENGYKQDIQNTNRRLDDLEKRMNQLPPSGDASALEHRIEALESRIKALSDKPAEKTLKYRVGEHQTPYYTPRTVPYYNPPDAGYGCIKLNSTYAYPVNVCVNGQKYYLTANEVRFIHYVPAGTFTFEVIESGEGVKTRSLSAGQTYTINIYNDSATYLINRCR